MRGATPYGENAVAGVRAGERARQAPPYVEKLETNTNLRLSVTDPRCMDGRNHMNVALIKPRQKNTPVRCKNKIAPLPDTLLWFHQLRRWQVVEVGRMSQQRERRKHCVTIDRRNLSFFCINTY